MIATSKGADPFPAETESRLQDFTELVATAISNASAHENVRALADEQAALRRVAMMVAQDRPAKAVFRTVVEEIGKLLGVDAVGVADIREGGTMSTLAMWAAHGDDPPAPERVSLEPGSLTWEIVRTGEPARKDDWSGVNSPAATILRDQMGVRSSVGAPIKHDDELWGTIAVHSKSQVLPPDTEARLERFAALVGTALTSAQAAARCASSRTSRRRCAGSRHSSRGRRRRQEVFAAIAEEIGRLLAVDSIEMVRFQDDRAAAFVAGWGSLAPRCRSERACRSAAGTSPRSSSAPAAPRASTTTTSPQADRSPNA